MKIYKEALDATQEVLKGIEGRVADGGISLPFIASMAANAGNGDHIEIGALFGASAIAVALTKQKLGLEGLVYCIDPYNAEARTAEVNINPNVAGQLNGTPEELLANAEKFGVELKLIQEYSEPWPKQLEANNFVSAYIDGDHLHGMPKKDFENLRGRVSNYIGFDNVEEGYPDVAAAFLEGAMTNEWFLFYKNVTFGALRRTMPPRGSGNTPMGSL